MTLDPLVSALRASQRPVWNRTVPTFLNRASPLTIVHVSPHVEFESITWTEQERKELISQWATAASKVPRTEAAARDVVQTLLWTASFYPSMIPTGTWGWLKKRPILPPDCKGRTMGSEDHVVRHVQGLGDIETLKSYLLVIFSEWDSIYPSGYRPICLAVGIRFHGDRMTRHRKDLVERLDHVLGQLDRGLPYLRLHKPRYVEKFFLEAKEQYTSLRKMLLEMDRQVV